eukprot:1144134-Prymnesium_polylepis.1
MRLERTIERRGDRMVNPARNAEQGRAPSTRSGRPERRAGRAAGQCAIEARQRRCWGVTHGRAYRALSRSRAAALYSQFRALTKQDF